MASAFANKLARAAEQQYDLYHFDSEADPPLARQIAKYWTEIKLRFPGVGTPWSAVFVSWCVKQAGATKAEFNFSAAHSQFVHKAIQNALNGEGVFRGLPVAARPPAVGDIIQNNRGGQSLSYDYARTHTSYASHSAIVIEIGSDAQGNYAMTIGGNESDSIRKKLVRLNGHGIIRQRERSRYICVIQNLK